MDLSPAKPELTSIFVKAKIIFPMYCHDYHRKCLFLTSAEICFVLQRSYIQMLLHKLP